MVGTSACSLTGYWDGGGLSKLASGDGTGLGRKLVGRWRGQDLILEKFDKSTHR